MGEKTIEVIHESSLNEVISPGFDQSKELDEGAASTRLEDEDKTTSARMTRSSLRLRMTLHPALVDRFFRAFQVLQAWFRPTRVCSLNVAESMQRMI